MIIKDNKKAFMTHTHSDYHKEFEEIKKKAIFDGKLKSCVPFFSAEVEGSKKMKKDEESGNYVLDDKCESCFIKNTVV